MRKKGFIYPGIFLLLLAILFLMRSCKASNLENERHSFVKDDISRYLKFFAAK